MEYVIMTAQINLTGAPLARKPAPVFYRGATSNVLPSRSNYSTLRPLPSGACVGLT